MCQSVKWFTTHDKFAVAQLLVVVDAWSQDLIREARIYLRTHRTTRVSL